MVESRRGRRKDDRRGKDKETDVALSVTVGELKSTVNTLKDTTDNQEKEIKWLMKNIYWARGAAATIGVLLALAVGAIGLISDDRFDAIIRLLDPGG